MLKLNFKVFPSFVMSDKKESHHLAELNENIVYTIRP